MKKLLMLLSVVGAVICCAAEKKAPSVFKEVEYPCDYDNSNQKALVWFAKGDEPRPLVVVLHTWSCNYKQGEPYARPAVKYNFHTIVPEFRGNNAVGNPQSMGSDAAVADIVSAVNWMKTQTKVDAERIYPGDTYFRISREKHNLDRARNQFKLVSDMEKVLPEMRAIVKKYAK